MSEPIEVAMLDEAVQAIEENVSEVKRVSTVETGGRSRDSTCAPYARVVIATKDGRRFAITVTEVTI